MKLAIEFNESKRYWWASISLLVVIIFYVHWDIITALYSQWLNNEDYSHGLLIIPISAYLIWRKRKELASTRMETDWRALLLVMLAIFGNAVGELGTDIFTIRFSILLLVVGCIWLSFGFEIFKKIKFPVLFLFLMLPLPGFLYRNITFPLQLLSSKLSVDLLNFFGFLAYREGNVIDLGFAQFEVVVACNGLRFIMPLLTVGVLFAFIQKRRWWERLLLICISVPLAIIANVFRISGTGMLSNIWGTKVAEGFFHSFSGWAVFMACFAVFLAINWGLMKISKDKKSSIKITNGGFKNSGIENNGMSVHVIPILAAIFIISFAGKIVGDLGSVEPVQLKRSLNEFPLDWETWQGTRDFMEEDIWKQVGAQEYIMIEYRSEGETPFGFYSSYYEYQRKIGDFVHSPKLCLPGAGWYIEKSSVRKLSSYEYIDGVGKTLKFNELVVEKDESRQLVYYWYQGRGRNLSNEYLSKFYLAFDGVFRRRTDGALVRLIMPIHGENTEELARETLDEFALYVSRELGEYFP